MKNFMLGNWKLNQNSKEEVHNFLSAFQKLNTNQKDYIGFASQAHQSSYALSLINKENIHMGSQDCSAKESGAFTSELAASSLKDFGVNFSLVGHSETRQYHNETNERCLEKINKCLDSNLLPVYCFGETLQEMEEERTSEVLSNQLSILKGLQGEIVLAYEPVWAIGTGKTASAEIIASRAKLIYEITNDSSLALLYGGSVKPENVHEIMSIEEIRGVLVGGASLKAESFARICAYTVDKS